MLKWILAATLCAGASTAHAGSVDVYKPTSGTRKAIIEIGCPACVRAAEQAAAKDVVTLEQGEQIIELRDTGSGMMVYRTEAWLGGSPVTMVSKASEADLIAHGAASAETQHAAAPETEVEPGDAEAVATVEPAAAKPVIANASTPGIDAETTSALAPAANAVPFDPSTYQLRLN